MISAKRMAVLISLFIFVHGTTLSAVIHVPGDQPTIQAGINAAQARDTVLVAPGTYHERIRFNGKGITVESASGAERTYIDGNQSDSVVSFDQQEGILSTLKGFTITNGDAVEGGGILCDGSSPQIIDNIVCHNQAALGSGIYCLDAEPVIRNNHIHDNGPSIWGGGIFCQSSSPLVEKNTIEWNRAIMSTRNHGGGIYCENTSNPIIADNNIEKNYGGGICCMYGCTPVIRNNFLKRNLSSLYSGIYCEEVTAAIIESNSIIKNSDNGIRCVTSEITIEGNVVSGHNKIGIESYACRGVIKNNTVLDNFFSGIRCDGSQEAIVIEQNWIQGNCGGVLIINCHEATITRNMIVDNHAYRGGGIYCQSSFYPVITNNFICRNKADDQGGGLRLYLLGGATVANNTFYGNTALKGGGVFSSGAPDLVVQNSILWENAPTQIDGQIESAYCNIQGGAPGTGNIDVDPRFVDAAGDDLHLLHASPCRDAGNNDWVNDAYDVEYDPRVVDNIVDMGADEYHPHLYYTSSDISPGGEATIKLVGAPNASPAAMFIGFDLLEQPLPTAWGDFFLKEPWFLYNLWPLPSNGLITIPTTLPFWTAPFEIPLQALVDWKLTNLCNIEVRRFNG